LESHALLGVPSLLVNVLPSYTNRAFRTANDALGTIYQTSF
jgi:hypothetical protein